MPAVLHGWSRPRLGGSSRRSAPLTTAAVAVNSRARPSCITPVATMEFINPNPLVQARRATKNRQQVRAVHTESLRFI